MTGQYIKAKILKTSTIPPLTGSDRFLPNWLMRATEDVVNRRKSRHVSQRFWLMGRRS